MRFSLDFMPRGAQFRGECIPIVIALNFGDDGTAGVRFGLAVELCAAHDPGVGHIAAQSLGLFDRAGPQGTLSLPVVLAGDDDVQAAGQGAKACRQRVPCPALIPPLPALAAQLPKARAVLDERFNVAFNQVPVQQFFNSIVAGTRYNMLIHPEVSGTITAHLKDVTLFEALDAVRELYGYDYKVEGTRIYIRPLTMQTRMFKVNYLTANRKGSSNVRVSSTSVGTVGATTSGQTGNGSSGSNSGNTPQPAQQGNLQQTQRDASNVTTTSDTDFWGDLKEALTALMGGVAEGRSLVISPQSGVIVVRAMPEQLRNVDQYLKATQLAVERQRARARQQEAARKLSEATKRARSWTHTSFRSFKSRTSFSTSTDDGKDDKNTNNSSKESNADSGVAIDALRGSLDEVGDDTVVDLLTALTEEQCNLLHNDIQTSVNTLINEKAQHEQISTEIHAKLLSQFNSQITTQITSQMNESVDNIVSEVFSDFSEKIARDLSVALGEVNDGVQRRCEELREEVMNDTALQIATLTTRTASTAHDISTLNTHLNDTNNTLNALVTQMRHQDGVVGEIEGVYKELVRGITTSASQARASLALQNAGHHLSAANLN
eukprot:gene32706-40363_t